MALIPALYQGRITRKTVFIHRNGKRTIWPIDCTCVTMLKKKWRLCASFLLLDSLMLSIFIDQCPMTWLNSSPNLLSDSCLHKGIILPRQMFLTFSFFTTYKRKRTFRRTKCHMEILPSLELRTQFSTSSYAATYFKPYNQIFFVSSLEILTLFHKIKKPTFFK